MSEAEYGDQAKPSPQRVGDRLRAAREAAGLSLAEVAARTRVPQRHLEAIEASDYAGLPSPTYATGFVRAYARAVDADEVGLARDVRIEAAQVARTTPRYEPYEIVDPARVPSRGVMIVAAGLGLAILILAILWFTTGLFRGGSTPAASDTTPIVASAPVPAASPSVVAPTGGQVALVAADEVWLRVYDAQNKTLFIGTMTPGQRFDVPADADRPMINVGRPDKLTVTLNGSTVPALGDGRRPIMDIPVDAAAIAARLNGGGGSTAAPMDATPAASIPPTAQPGVAAQPTQAARPAAAATQRRSTATPRARPTSRSSPRARPTARREGPEDLLPSGFRVNP